MPNDPAAHALLAAGIEALDSGITVFDADLKLVAANRRFSELIGIPPEVARPGTGIEALFRYNAEHGEYGAGEIDAIVAERVAIARRFEAHSFERERPDGRIIDVRGTPLPGGGFVTIYTDVTTHRRREQALEKLRAELESRVAERTAELAYKRAQLEQIVDNIRHGITQVNGKLEMELCNTQFLDIMRFPAEFARSGRPFADFIRYNAERGEYGPGDIDAIIAARVEQARHPVPHRFERTRPDGTTIEVIGNPTPDGGFVTTYIDVTERKRAEAALRESEQRFRDFASAGADWYFETDAELRYTWFSEQTEERTGVRVAGALGKRREDLTRPEFMEKDADNWRRHLADMAAHLPYRDFSYPFVDSAGRHRDVSVSGTPAFDENGKFLGYRGTGREITAYRAAERALQESEALLRTIMEASPVGVALISREHFIIRTCNGRLAEMARRPIDEMIGQPAGEACTSILASLDIDQPIDSREIELEREDGTKWWALLTTRPLSYRGEATVLLWIYDISELHGARESVERLALHDPLTDIPNRRYLLDFGTNALARAARQGTRGALIYLDLDGFKTVNDRLGHQQGDRLLRAIAHALRTRIRRSDFVARLGGDEFAIIVEGITDDHEPLNLAHSMIAVISDAASTALPDSGFDIAASAGIAFFDGIGAGFDALLGRADAAMYRAKQAGRATVCIEATDA